MRIGCAVLPCGQPEKDLYSEKDRAGAEGLWVSLPLLLAVPHLRRMECTELRLSVSGAAGKAELFADAGSGGSA